MSDGPTKVLRRKLPPTQPATDSIAKKMGDAAAAFEFAELGPLMNEVSGSFGCPGCFVVQPTNLT